MFNGGVYSSQFLRYVFHLFVDENVDSVKILTDKQMPNGSLTLFLKRCLDDRKHWQSPELFIHCHEKETFRYRYVIKYKEGLMTAVATFFVSKFTGKRDEKTVQERQSRKLNAGMCQYDIFHDPSDHFRIKSVFLGQMFFVKMLYQELANGGDLKELLIECEHIGFGHPGYAVEDVKWFLKWIEDMMSNRRTPYQGVYVCSLLGQFVERARNWTAGYTCSSLKKKAVDSILLSCLCGPYAALPQSSKRFIKIVAESLFEAGSSEGCLQFIKYFCNVLDVNYVMQVADKRSSLSYSEHQFDQQVAGVLDSLKRLKDPNNFSRYSFHVIRCCPSISCLWNLHQMMSFHFPTWVHSLTEEFTSIYCKFISCSRTRKPDLLHPLFWCQVPGNMKEKLASPFCKALADQIVSETTWSKERVASLKTIVFDSSLHSSDQFHHFILSIVTHKCKDVVFILPDLLETIDFCHFWKSSNFSDEDRVKVCNHWLRTNFNKGGSKPKDKILGVVEAYESLSKTEALKDNKALCEGMEKEVECLVLKRSVFSIMDAFKEASSRALGIQQRLQRLLRSAVKQQSGTEDCRSKYRQMIHMLGFDVSKEGKRDLRKVKLDR